MSKHSTSVRTRSIITEIAQQSRPSRIVEDFVIIWLDPNIDEYNSDTQNSITQLQEIVNSVQTFIHPDQCIDFITDITNEKTFLILSASLAQQLLPLIQNIDQVHSVYIYSTNETQHGEWATKYPKLKGVFTQIHLVCDIIKKDVRQSASDLTPITILTSNSCNNRNELDQSFMCSQLLKEILIDLPHDEKDKKELVSHCRQHYADNYRELRIIDEFDKKYDQASSIWWYTRECFTYSMLNKALRTQDIEIIIKMGFFVRELHLQIQQLHYQSNSNHLFMIYRGQGMLNDEFEKLKKSKGCLLSFNNFLSTSVKKEVAIRFVCQSRENSLLTAVLFEMEVNPSISSTPFASLDRISYYSDKEKEVLF